jgi:hypothetical protein
MRQVHVDTLPVEVRVSVEVRQDGALQQVALHRADEQRRLAVGEGRDRS